MRFAVDAWQPEYGSGTDAAALEQSEVETQIDVEVPVGSWDPIRPAVDRPARPVYVVDGVRRVEARVWITEPDGALHLGIAASFAAGVVRCDARAEVVAAEVRRRLFTSAPSAEEIVGAHTRFPVSTTPSTSFDGLSLDLQGAMAVLEAQVARDAGATDGLLIVDGPLRPSSHPPGTVGSIKTQHRSYGPPIVQTTIGKLGAGERTPLFVVAGGFPAWSWYVRLPGPVPHPMASVVRCVVAPDVPRAEVIELADVVTRTLPRYASSPAKDARAPQNLYPIAGLERELRRRLGDQAIVLRDLSVAARRAG